MKRLLFVLIFTSFPAFADVNSYIDPRQQLTATFASGATTATELDLGGTMIVGIQLPATFTGTALTFSAATTSGGTSQLVKDGAGNSISKTVAQGQYIAIDPTLFKGIRFVKIISGSTEAAARTATVITIPAQ